MLSRVINSSILIIICSLILMQQGRAQLRFPVRRGYIKQRDARSVHWREPEGEIQMTGKSDKVYPCEPGVVISVFKVEGDQYALIRGKFFICYGPFMKINIRRLQQINGRKRLGTIEHEKAQRKYLDLIIMQNESVKLPIDSVFSRYVKKMTVN